MKSLFHLILIRNVYDAFMATFHSSFASLVMQYFLSPLNLAANQMAERGRERTCPDQTYAKHIDMHTRM